VIRNQNLEDAAEEEGPCRLARLNRTRGRLLECRIDKPIARADGGEDPRAKSPFLSGERQPADPSGVDLQLLTRRAVDDGNRRRRAPEIEFDDGEAMQRGVRDHHALAGQQLANFREPNALLQPLLDRRLLLAAPCPAIAAWPAASWMQREQHVADLRVGEGSTVARQTDG